jgi:hypothetical protein
MCEYFAGMTPEMKRAPASTESGSSGLESWRIGDLETIDTPKLCRGMPKVCRTRNRLESRPQTVGEV